MISDKEFQRRLKSIEGTRQSNCHGTALFLAGCFDKDIIPTYETLFRAAQLPISAMPSRYDIAVLVNQTSQGLVPVHRGVVFSVDPLLIVHRPFLGGYLSEPLPLHEIFTDSPRDFLYAELMYQEPRRLA